MKHAAGNPVERCPPSKNNTGAALGKAAGISGQASGHLESEKAWSFAILLYISRSLSGTFQGMVYFDRRESLGLFFLY